MVHLEDLAAAHEASAKIGNFSDLVREVAALKAESQRQRQFIQLLLHAAGIQQTARDFTDDELLDLLRVAKEGARKFSPVSADRLRCLADSIFLIDDRTLRRLEHKSGDKNAWRDILHFLEDVDDGLDGRLDTASDELMRYARMQLGLARQHFVTQVKFVLALQHPLRNPRELLSELSLRASKLNLSEPRSIDVGTIISDLVDRATSAPGTGRCPDGE